MTVWPSTDYESLGSADWNARATACALFSEVAAELGAGNDFQVMEAHLCRKLRSSEPYCQSDAYAPFRY